MNFWLIMIFMAGAFVMQYVFGIYQIKNFSKSFGKLRRMGKVAIGRCPGRIRAGVIVMFAIDDYGMILRTERMQGVTALAGFKEIKEFDGKILTELSEKDLVKYNSQFKKAVLDAINVYNTVMNGGEIPENPSPFKKVGNMLTQR